MQRALLCSLVLLLPMPAVRAQGQGKPDQKNTSEQKSTVVLSIEDALTADDPKHKVTNGPHKVHTVQLTAGKTYQIDLLSGEFNCAVLLEDASGKQLTNSRILFDAPKTASYRIIATGRGTGPYRLTVKEASAAAVASVPALLLLDKDFNKNFALSRGRLHRDYAHAKSDAEKKQFLDDFTTEWKKFEDALTKIAQDARGEGAGPNAERMARMVQGEVAYEKGHIAVSAGEALQKEYEQAVEAKDEKADGLYRKAENYFAEGAKKHAGDAGLANEFKDHLYRLQNLSVGKLAPDIEGEDLDGKQFKLSDYRGKVVVISFWAFW